MRATVLEYQCAPNRRPLRHGWPTLAQERGAWQNGPARRPPKQKSPPQPEPGGRNGGPVVLLNNPICPLASLGLEGFNSEPGLFHGAGDEAAHAMVLMPTSA